MSKIYYHGSDNKFSEFNNMENKVYKEFDIETHFFTENINYAKKYGKYLYKATLNINNTFDTSNKTHMKIFCDYVKEQNEDLLDILDEQFYNGIPYWTCGNAFWAAISNGFDSILIQEELDKEILSIGVFDKDKINIIDVLKESKLTDKIIREAYGFNERIPEKFSFIYRDTTKFPRPEDKWACVKKIESMMKNRDKIKTEEINSQLFIPVNGSTDEAKIPFVVKYFNSYYILDGQKKPQPNVYQGPAMVKVKLVDLDLLKIGMDRQTSYHN